MPAAFNPLSPSASTHHPCGPVPPSPASTVAKLASAYARLSSLYVPGCRKTAVMPRSLASASALRVTPGPVMMDTEVSAGDSRDVRVGLVGWSTSATLMADATGLMGVTAREWVVYQAKTGGAG